MMEATDDDKNVDCSSSNFFCLRDLAGELRWIASKDEALDRRMLREARSLEDLYFAKVKKDQDKRNKVARDAMMEAKMMRTMVDQIVVEEGLGSCKMEEDMLNEAMDKMVEGDVREMVEETPGKRKRQGKYENKAKFINPTKVIPHHSGVNPLAVHGVDCPVE